jgi:zinc transport system substrate-binding protein
MDCKNTRTISAFLLIILIVFILTGCGHNAGNGTGNDGQFTIVTSFYPVYIATINVARNISGVDVINMTRPQTGCLHDYSLKPEDLKTLEKADVFVINGAGMESFLDDVIKQYKDLIVIEASRGIQLLEDENGEANPHVWISIENSIAYVNNIAAGLSGIDIENSDKYTENAAEYVKKLTALRKEMHDALDGLKNRDIVTFHEAFPYFAHEFDLTIAAVINREPGTEPAPKELAEIIETVSGLGVKALFAEPQYSSKSADAIARETGAKVYTLDPVVTGEADADAYDAYIEAMKRNKEVLLEALR